MINTQDGYDDYLIRTTDFTRDGGITAPKIGKQNKSSEGEYGGHQGKHWNVQKNHPGMKINVGLR